MTFLKVHQVKVNPISGEFEHATSFFGTIFDVTNFDCLLDDGCLSFTTRHDGVPDNTKTPSNSTSMYTIFILCLPSFSPTTATFCFSEPHGRSNVCALVPANVGSTSGTASSYPPSLGFNDSGSAHITRFVYDLTPIPVPIYDARQQSSFDFSSASLTNLAHLPFYKNNKRDPDGDSYVCTVGYGVNIWSQTRGGHTQPCISLNILFLIILSKLGHS